MNQKIKDEAREKIAEKINLMPKDGYCYGRDIADQILSLSGETDEVCLNGVDGLMSGNDGEKSIRVPCIICKGTGTITKKWRVEVNEY